MNLTIVRALLLDALYQVLDNKVFRILIVAIALLVLVPLLLNFREDGVKILFGTWSFPYDSFLDFFGGMIGASGSAVSSMSSSEVQELCIQGYQSVIVTGLMGNIGIFICLAATAFFIPQMVEKGAADTIFSKPVSRPTLLVARYLTGVLFVGILACLLVFGTHFALLIGSGESDSAFLWNALALTYKFSLLYAVTLLIGVVTRSTVASILLTIIFMTFNSCVHWAWENGQMNTDREMETGESRGGDSGGITVTVNGEEQSGGELIEASEDSESNWFIDTIWGLTKTLHYTLPKTGDASTIATKLQTSFAGDENSPFQDEEMAFELKSLPPTFEAIDSASLDGTSELFPPAEDGTIVFAAVSKPSGARLLVHRRPVLEEPRGSSGRMRRESSRSAEKAFTAWLEADESRQQDSLEKFSIAAGTTWNRSARDFRWTAFRTDKNWSVRTLVVREGDWFGSIQLEVPEGAELDEAIGEHFGNRDYMFGSGSINSMNATRDSGAWFAEKLDWTGDWKYSIWFSVGSSLGFVLMCILLSWWRLSRIDF